MLSSALESVVCNASSFFDYFCSSVEVQDSLNALLTTSADDRRVLNMANKFRLDDESSLVPRNARVVVAE